MKWATALYSHFSTRPKTFIKKVNGVHLDFMLFYKDKKNIESMKTEINKERES